ncbi:calcium-binding protein [Geitlerinema sp. PCC 9228]|uniref:calcium-binding protein n=1 Tax=Geitlerinema sp. PCC 9228 TaxID=111611 RepID=UPI0008F9B0E1|nr:calcium-binding protein [Geitlerinema sp. PCC 9228]
MVLDITTGGPEGFDTALATDASNTITFNQLPNGELLQLKNSPSQDAIALQGGNDTVIDNDESRLYFGNVGIDQLNGNGGSDSLVAGKDNDSVEGGSGDDFLFGNVGNDIVSGGIGNDLLHGGQNEDELNGGDGNDTLHGDIGFDTLTGEGGSDEFALSLQSGTDTITDFESGTDKISLPDGVSFSDLQVAAAGEDTTISLANSGQQLAVLSNVDNSEISVDDFVNPESTGSLSREPRNLLNTTSVLEDANYNYDEIENFLEVEGFDTSSDRVDALLNDLQSFTNISNVTNFGSIDTGVGESNIVSGPEGETRYYLFSIPESSDVTIRQQDLTGDSLMSLYGASIDQQADGSNAISIGNQSVTLDEIGNVALSVGSPGREAAIEYKDNAVISESLDSGIYGLRVIPHSNDDVALYNLSITRG